MTDNDPKDDCFHVEVRLRHEDSGERDESGLKIHRCWWECRRCEARFVEEPRPAPREEGWVRTYGKSAYVGVTSDVVANERISGLTAEQRAWLEHYATLIIHTQTADAITVALAEIDDWKDTAQRNYRQYEAADSNLIAARKEIDELTKRLDRQLAARAHAEAERDALKAENDALKRTLVKVPHIEERFGEPDASGGRDFFVVIHDGGVLMNGHDEERCRELHGQCEARSVLAEKGKR